MRFFQFVLELFMFHRTMWLIPMFALFSMFVSAAGVPASGNCGDQSKIPADKRLSNTAHWTTASEEENFGYDVYRGNSEQGPFTKLTKQPMLGNGTTNETHQYKFIDDTIDPCKDYWYYVESITDSGVREKFTPVFRAPAKIHQGEQATSATAPAKPASH
jgi:hypothetical protein